ncbi:hypothetical protein VTN02DRAFT_2014 [Thermoascus thermophilus]
MKNRPAQHGITGRGFFFQTFLARPSEPRTGLDELDNKQLGKCAVQKVIAVARGERSCGTCTSRSALALSQERYGRGAGGGHSSVARGWCGSKSAASLARPSSALFCCPSRLSPAWLATSLAIHLGTARSIAHSTPSSRSFVASVLPASSAGRVCFPRSSGYSGETSPAWHCASPLHFTVFAFLFESVTGQAPFKVHEFSCCL